MPALLEISATPPTVSEKPVEVASSPERAGSDTETPDAPQRICSGCYLSEAELNRTGLLGCPRCYETFAPLIASAATVLHNVHVPASWTESKPRQTVTNPWPTRRGIRISEQ